MSGPVERVRAALEAHDCQPKASGKGFVAQCPGHEDNRASLSLTEGDDGKVLLKCHAGCAVPAIVAEAASDVRDAWEESNASPKP